MEGKEEAEARFFCPAYREEFTGTTCARRFLSANTKALPPETTRSTGKDTPRGRFWCRGCPAGSDRAAIIYGATPLELHENAEDGMTIPELPSCPRCGRKPKRKNPVEGLGDYCHMCTHSLNVAFTNRGIYPSLGQMLSALKNTLAGNVHGHVRARASSRDFFERFEPIEGEAQIIKGLGGANKGGRKLRPAKLKAPLTKDELCIRCQSEPNMGVGVVRGLGAYGPKCQREAADALRRAGIARSEPNRRHYMQSTKPSGGVTAPEVREYLRKRAKEVGREEVMGPPRGMEAERVPALGGEYQAAPDPMPVPEPVKVSAEPKESEAATEGLATEPRGAPFRKETPAEPPKEDPNVRIRKHAHALLDAVLDKFLG